MGVNLNAPDPEIMGKKRRRKFTAAYKLRILEEADTCTLPGQIGALLRREGLYASNLTTWRRQREEGQLKALSPRKRGRKPNPDRHLAKRVAQLERENQRLRDQIKKAQKIIRVQKKNLQRCGDLPSQARNRREQLIRAAVQLRTEVGTAPACDALGISRATFYRRLKPTRAQANRPAPPLALSDQERQTVIDLLHCERFQDAAPRQIFACLLDEGTYHCSVRTMYRILRDE
ncbi:transposase [Desulfacinum hydrothermale]|nr:transposase [Desulfacinum hydrothermale]